MPNRINGIFRRKEPPPCERDCADRCIGCHSKCEKYIEWKTKEDKRKKVHDEMHNDEKAVADYVIEVTTKCAKFRKG